VIARLLHGGEDPGRAVASGRWILDAGLSGFATWSPASEGRVLVEGHAPAGWEPGLAERGHPVLRTAPFGHQYGHAHVILAGGDRLAGASDPRPRSGAASGY